MVVLHELFLNLKQSYKYSEKEVLRMPSDNEKGIEFPQKNGKKKHQKKSIGWIIGVVVLILISITFILPTTALSGGSNSIEFGRYNGEKISLEYGNYFYNQIASLSSQYSSNASNSFQIYYQAYYATVLETALRQMANQAGIKTTDSMVNNAIISSGTFAGSNGTFDAEVYRNTPEVERSAVRNYMKEVLPAQMVMDDISSVRTSSAETEFITALNANRRAFQYITVTSETYPDADAIAYAEATPAPFESIGLSVITVATADEANEILASITSGEKTFEDAAIESSTDDYAENGGDVGLVMYTVLEGQLRDRTNAETIFSASVGDILGPFQTVSGYSICKINTEVGEPNLDSEYNLNVIKNYIATNDPDTMSAYLETKAEEIYAVALEDWDTAAATDGVTVTDVASSAPNPALSSIISGMTYSDPNYLLSNVLTGNEDLNRELFTSEIGSVSGPVLSGLQYIIIRSVESTDSTDLSSSYITALYPSFIVPQVAQSDLQSAVLSSPDFEDNFFTVYFSQML